MRLVQTNRNYLSFWLSCYYHKLFIYTIWINEWMKWLLIYCLSSGYWPNLKAVYCTLAPTFAALNPARRLGRFASFGFALCARILDRFAPSSCVFRIRIFGRCAPSGFVLHTRFNAQDLRRCATLHHHHHLKKKSPQTGIEPVRRVLTRSAVQLLNHSAIRETLQADVG